MRYIAKQPRDGINVSDTHPLIEAGSLIAGLGIIFIGLVIALVFLVEISLYFVSPEKEAELFSGWTPADFVSVSSDDQREVKIQALTDRLVAHWSDAHYSYRVAVDDSEQPNAMALPGGLIVVTRGLLDQVESENELAFVLGHELGHFRNRDHIRALGRGIVVSLLFATLIGADGSGFGVTIADVTLKGFGREQEKKADEFGLDVINAEYGHIGEASRLFERWGAGSNSQIEFVNYLSTHPGSRDRIRSLKAYARDRRWQTSGKISPLGWALPDSD